MISASKSILSRPRRILAILIFFASVQSAHAEWGFEGFVGTTMFTNYKEDLFLERNTGFVEQSLTEINGRRGFSRAYLQLFYENYGMHFELNLPQPGSGNYQVRRSESLVVESGGGGNFTDISDFTLKAFRRSFFYGGRPYVTVSAGYQFRRIRNFSQYDSQVEQADVDLNERYVLLGVLFDPVIWRSNQFELSVPIGIDFGLGHSPGKAAFEDFFDRKKLRFQLNAGFRLQWEPRGVFTMLNASFDFTKAPFDVDGIDRAEVNLTYTTFWLGIGYFFKSPTYNLEPEGDDSAEEDTPSDPEDLEPVD